MTVDLTKHTDLGRLADSVGALVVRIDRQTTALENATTAMRRHRRTVWVAIAALVVALVAGGLVVRGELADRTQRDQADRTEEAAERRAACERGNLIKEAVVRAAGVAVTATALELADDDPAAQAEARQLGADVAATVAQDPGLRRLRDCT